MTIKEMIEKAVKKAGSKKELARFLGVNRYTIYRWITGENKPKEAHLNALEIISREKKKNGLR